MLNQDNYDEYNIEPVVYCKRCYSLKIKYEPDIDSDCCMECGCTDTDTASIGEWEKLYEKRYGKKFTEKSNDIRKSPIFNLPISKLKKRLYDCPQWLNVIRGVYPRFPRGLGKADSITLLFDKITRDNKLDELRIQLMKYIKN